MSLTYASLNNLTNSNGKTVLLNRLHHMADEKEIQTL
jgi:hypothetical protein